MKIQTIKNNKNISLIVSERLLNIYKEKKIPKFLSQLVLIDLLKKEEFQNLVGYQLLSHNWIDELCKIFTNKSLLEICSGNGALSYILRQKKIDIISTDNMDFTKNSKTYFMWTDIIEADAIQSIETYGPISNYILCSFFPNKEIAQKAIIKMKDIQRETNENLKMIIIDKLGFFNIKVEKLFNIHIEKINKIIPCYTGNPVEVLMIR